ncbi:glucose dehydrogenase B protein [Microcella alkaliphila]|uniref:Glucose dehydrogenase B protein n=1 Tax=Microcella alkaliphila TaxID=279828 RepID=A0A0U4WTY4_9MICO|nr:glucose dehydrogenase B protein [Microcella alkaliphila]
MTGLAAPWSVGPLSGAAGALEVGELHEGTVPADNPFDGSLVLSIGHRNPQGLAFDRDG